MLTMQMYGVGSWKWEARSGKLEVAVIGCWKMEEWKVGRTDNRQGKKEGNNQVAEALADGWCATQPWIGIAKSQ